MLVLIMEISILGSLLKTTKKRYICFFVASLFIQMLRHFLWWWWVPATLFVDLLITLQHLAILAGAWFFYRDYKNGFGTSQTQSSGQIQV